MASAIKKEAIECSQAPKPIGPYSQAIKVGNTVYLSGQIPWDPQEGKLTTGSVVDKAEQVFENIKAVVTQAGGSLSDVVKMTIFITDFDNYKSINLVMEKYFTKPYPARSCVAVKALPLEVPLEVEAIVVLPSAKL